MNSWKILYTRWVNNRVQANQFKKEKKSRFLLLKPNQSGFTVLEDIPVQSPEMQRDLGQVFDRALNFEQRVLLDKPEPLGQLVNLLH